jgi:hypothetical protein
MCEYFTCYGKMTWNAEVELCSSSVLHNTQCYFVQGLYEFTLWLYTLYEGWTIFWMKMWTLSVEKLNTCIMNIESNQERFKCYNIFIFPNQLVLSLSLQLWQETTPFYTFNIYSINHNSNNNNYNNNNNTTHKTDHCYPNTHLRQLYKKFHALRTVCL